MLVTYLPFLAIAVLLVAARGTARSLQKWQRVTREESRAETKRLGFDGADPSKTLTATVDGTEVRLRTDHWGLRNSDSQSRNVVHMVFAIDVAGTIDWWLAPDAKRARFTRAVAEHPVVLPGRGGVVGRASAEPEGWQPWADPDLMERCEKAGLTLARLEGGTLEVYFRQGGDERLEPPGRIREALHCALAIADESHRKALDGVPVAQEGEPMAPIAPAFLAGVLAAFVGPALELPARVGVGYEWWQAAVVCGAAGVLVTFPVALVLLSRRRGATTF